MARKRSRPSQIGYAVWALLILSPLLFVVGYLAKWQHDLKIYVSESSSLERSALDHGEIPIGWHGDHVVTLKNSRVWLVKPKTGESVEVDPTLTNVYSATCVSEDGLVLRLNAKDSPHVRYRWAGDELEPIETRMEIAPRTNSATCAFLPKSGIAAGAEPQLNPYAVPPQLADLGGVVEDDQGEWSIVMVKDGERRTTPLGDPDYGFSPSDEFSFVRSVDGSRYLLHANGDDFPDPPIRWSPVAWLLDADLRQARQIVLPRGEWETHPIKDTSSCFSCGCSCYRHLTLHLAGPYIYAVTWGMRMFDAYAGIYQLDTRDPAATWVHVLNRGIAGAIAPSRDGCRIAYFDGQIGTLEMC